MPPWRQRRSCRNSNKTFRLRLQMKPLGLFLPFHRSPTDIPAAEAAGPVDLGDGFVGAGLGFGDRRAIAVTFRRDRRRRGGGRLRVLCRRGRSRHPGTWTASRDRESGCPCWRTGVTLGGHDDGERGVRAPVHRHAVQPPSAVASINSSRSDFSRSISTCVSGSPKRTLYSISWALGCRASGRRTDALERRAARGHAAHGRRMISASRVDELGVITGAGE